MHQALKPDLSNPINLDEKLSLRAGAGFLKVYPIDRPGRKRSWTLVWKEGSTPQKRELSCPHTTQAEINRIVNMLNLGANAAANLSPHEANEYALLKLLLPGVTLKDLVDNFRKQTDKPVDYSVTVQKCSEEHLEALKASNKSIRHQGTQKHIIKKFCAAFRKPIATITTGELEIYLNSIPNYKTRLNHRIGLIALFSFARKRKYLPQGFPTAAEGTSRPKVVKKEPQILRPALVRKLLRGCSDPKLLAFLAIGAFAGCRPAEIQRLKWADIRPGGIFLSTHITKSSRRRIAEIPENLQQWLRPLRGKDGDFVTHRSATYLYKQLGELRTRLGIEWDDDILRHTWVSCHSELHGHLSRTSKSGGHSVSMLETTYLQLVPKPKARLHFSVKPNISLPCLD